MQVQTPAWHLLVFFSFNRFFCLLDCYCLFSLLTLLASRDFCQNVFLVILVPLTITKMFRWGPLDMKNKETKQI